MLRAPVRSRCLQQRRRRSPFEAPERAAPAAGCTGTSLIGVNDEFTNAGLAASHSAANNTVPARKIAPEHEHQPEINPASASTRGRRRSARTAGAGQPSEWEDLVSRPGQCVRALR